MDTFGNLWRTHSWENNTEPVVTTRHKSGARSQAETGTSLSFSRAANTRPKSARFTSESSGAALRSSQANPTERNFLDLVALAKTLPNSGQAAEHSANHKLVHAEKTGGDFKRQQWHHH